MTECMICNSRAINRISRGIRPPGGVERSPSRVALDPGGVDGWLACIGYEPIGTRVVGSMSSLIQLWYWEMYNWRLP